MNVERRCECFDHRVGRWFLLLAALLAGMLTPLFALRYIFDLDAPLRGWTYALVAVLVPAMVGAVHVGVCVLDRRLDAYWSNRPVPSVRPLGPAPPMPAPRMISGASTKELKGEMR